MDDRLTHLSTLGALVGDQDTDTFSKNNVLERMLSSGDGSNSNNRNEILYIIYLSVLGLCCLSPCFYYLRLWHWQRHRLRRLRELERAGLAVAMARSSGRAGGTTAIDEHGETLAIHEERKARIAQLMEPVRMILEENQMRDISPKGGVEQALPAEQSVLENDIECGNLTPWKRKACDCQIMEDGDTQLKSIAASMGSNEEEDGGTGLGTIEKTEAEDGGDDEEEDTKFIEIPLPGLILRQGVFAGDAITQPPFATCRTGTQRCVPAFCAICLSGYEPGTEIVWSSNRQCSHVFHEDCIRQWLIKLPQREGPICPCCRRDFLIDPYDLVLTSAMAGDENQNGALAVDGIGDNPTVARKDNNVERITESSAHDFVSEIGRDDTQDTIELGESDVDSEDQGRDASQQ